MNVKTYLWNSLRWPAILGPLVPAVPTHDRYS